MAPLWAQASAETFWDAAGGSPAVFPRDLRPAIAWALPLTVVDLPRLRVASLEDWLAACGLATGRIGGPDRALRACLVAAGGRGIVFLDAADPPDEQRFSLAHEVAHFLVEHLDARERTRSRLGAEALDVLDGRRSPSHRERVDAVLAGVVLRRDVHLMERTPDGHLPNALITRAERQADALARELLAPIDEVRRRLRPGTTASEAAELLRTEFGLPAVPATDYARQVCLPPSPDVALLESLGLGDVALSPARAEHLPSGDA